MLFEKLEAEKEQSVIRFLLGVGSFSYLLLNGPFQVWIGIVYSLFFFFAFVIFYSVRRVPGEYLWRILLGQFTDIISISFTLFLGGERAAPMIGAYLWVIVGNGLRFGPCYMFSAILLANGCFAYIALYEPFWKENHIFVLAVVGVQLFVPMYFLMLLYRRKVTRKKLELISYKDELTGLLNRRSFYQLLNDEIYRLKQSPQSATLVFIDIDHFKTINDTYGHLAGDLVLVNVARILQKTCRKVDTVADRFAAS